MAVNRIGFLLQLPIHQQPPADTLLAQLTEAEADYRQQRRYETALKAVRFRYQASVAEVQCSVAHNLDQALFFRLAEGSFIGRGKNVFITAATGCGTGTSSVSAGVSCGLRYGGNTYLVAGF